jgi:hypothetical protein
VGALRRRSENLVMSRLALCSAFLLLIVTGCSAPKHWYIEKVVPAGNSTGSREAVFGGPFDSEQECLAGRVAEIERETQATIPGLTLDFDLTFVCKIDSEAEVLTKH